MAYQSNPKATGENIAAPTKAGRPAGETYKTPRGFRSQPALRPKSDIAGVNIPATRFGSNQYPGAVSGGTGPDTADLSDLDISPPDHDAARESLIARGTGPQNHDLNNVQTRTLAPGNVPDGFGMKGADRTAVGTLPKTGASPSGDDFNARRAAGLDRMNKVNG